MARVEAADPELRVAMLRAMLSMLGDKLIAVIREKFMNTTAFPESEAFKAFRLELEARGEVRGEARALALLVRQFERKIGRALTPDERTRLQERLHVVGPERLGDIVLDLAGAELARWLTDVSAR